MITAITSQWRKVVDELPEEHIVVSTKIDDEAGVRNETRLKRIGKMWVFADGSMYVYHAPTHWRYIGTVGGRS